MTNSLTTYCQRIERIVRKSELSNPEVFIFGSALFSNHFEDLDLLMVYNHSELSEALRVRRELVKEVNDINMDILLLNQYEMIEFSQLENWKKSKII